MSAAVGAPDAVTHLGVLYDDADDLVATVTPYLGRALDRGDAVSTLVDRRTARGLRDALGDRAGVVHSDSPHAGAPRGEDLLRRLRSTVAAAGRHAVVLTQYSAFGTTPEEIALSEAGIDVVLADLPLTMLCACARDAGAPLLDVARHSHPGWAHGPVPADNPAYRPPADRSPTPSAVWGGVHVLRLHFGCTADLARVRTHVAAVAAEVGLRGETAQAAVLAVHEAAVVACDEVDDARALAPAGPVDAPAAGPGGFAEPEAVRPGTGVDDPCVLDVWTAGPRLVAEVHGPRAAVASAAADPIGPADTGEDRLPRNRLRMAGPLRLVRAFCRDVVASETGTSRTTRIVAGP